MPSFLNLNKALRRVRHGRGFGIHSPFAYRFITEVLNLPSEYGYYQYLYIKEGTPRTIFRIAVRFQPAKVCVVGEQPDVRKAITCAVPKAAYSDMAEAEMIVFDASKQRKLPVEAIPTGTITVILNYKKWKNRLRYLEALPAGMTFSNASSMCVVVPLAHLPRQDFDVKF